VVCRSVELIVKALHRRPHGVEVRMCVDLERDVG